ncbi:zf-HC2 domain-containing protein [bacterium]|nr:zf-HC2 domain-containing protein [bacterium]
MNCEQVLEILVSQLGGETNREEDLQLKNHLDECESCRREQKEFRAMLGLMKQLPPKEWDERIRIQDLLRRDQKWRTIVFGKAALWFLATTAFITVLTTLPLQWQVNAQEFSVRWGTPPSDMTEELKKLQLQLTGIQQQNQQFYQISEARMKELVEQKNIEQQKRYWDAMQMFSNYLQLQRQADLQKIQHEIATTYDRTGQEVEKTNELLEHVLRTSAGEGTVYEGN